MVEVDIKFALVWLQGGDLPCFTAFLFFLKDLEPEFSLKSKP